MHEDPPARSALISHAIRIPDIFKLPQRLIGARRLTPPVLSKHQTSWAPITTLETPSLRALIAAVRIANQYYSVILGPRQVRRSCAGVNMLFTVGVKNRRMDRWSRPNASYFFQYEGRRTVDCSGIRHFTPCHGGRNNQCRLLSMSSWWQPTSDSRSHRPWNSTCWRINPHPWLVWEQVLPRQVSWYGCWYLWGNGDSRRKYRSFCRKKLLAFTSFRSESIDEKICAFHCYTLVCETTVLSLSFIVPKRGVSFIVWMTGCARSTSQGLMEIGYMIFGLPDITLFLSLLKIGREWYWMESGKGRNAQMLYIIQA